MRSSSWLTRLFAAASTSLASTIKDAPAIETPPPQAVLPAQDTYLAITYSPPHAINLELRGGRPIEVIQTDIGQATLPVSTPYQANTLSSNAPSINSSSIFNIFSSLLSVLSTATNEPTITALRASTASNATNTALSSPLPLLTNKPVIATNNDTNDTMKSTKVTTGTNGVDITTVITENATGGSISKEPDSTGTAFVTSFQTLGGETGTAADGTGAASGGGGGEATGGSESAPATQTGVAATLVSDKMLVMVLSSWAVLGMGGMIAL